MGGFVFVSYGREDRAYVERLAAHLRGNGVRVWYDEHLLPGQQWELSVRDQIAACDAVLVVMTPAAEASVWVQRELNYAEKLGRTVVPLLRAGEVFFRLSNLQYEDVRRGPPTPQLVKALRSLTTVRSADGDADAATPWSATVLENRSSFVESARWAILVQLEHSQHVVMFCARGLGYALDIDGTNVWTGMKRTEILRCKFRLEDGNRTRLMTLTGSGLEGSLANLKHIFTGGDISTVIVKVDDREVIRFGWDGKQLGSG